MKYFEDILKKYTDADNNEIPNLSRTVNIDSVINSEYLIDYYIKDGDTPELLALNLYNDKDMWWVIPVVNKMLDIYNEWPLTSRVLKSWYTKLVADGEITGTAAQKAVIFATLKTENNAKRKVSVIDPKFIGDFQKDLQTVINNI